MALTLLLTCDGCGRRFDLGPPEDVLLSQDDRLAAEAGDMVTVETGWHDIPRGWWLSRSGARCPACSTESARRIEP